MTSSSVASHALSETSESLGPGRACPGPLALPTRTATRVHPSHQSRSLPAAPSHPSCSLRDGTGLPRPGPRPGRAVPRPGAMASETRYLVERAAARGSVGRASWHWPSRSPADRYLSALLGRQAGDGPQPGVPPITVVRINRQFFKLARRAAQGLTGGPLVRVAPVVSISTWRWLMFR